nr:SEC-C domain-containing protein [Nitrospirota bacterium]
MANNPFRGGPKIGRNDPCFCGSGRKFKHCHGGVQHTLPALLALDRVEKEIIEQGRRYFEKHKVQELQRQKQQGLGRPIISIEYKGYRFLAVGSRLHYGKWKTFFDFLAYYIKHALGSEWGNAEIAKPLAERHPLMQWYDKVCHLQAAHTKEPGALFSTPMTGAVSAYNRLAYNLYLIAHNGKDIQTRLITRLKNKDNFQGAFFETQVAAWLIRAGFELEFEDESDRTSKHCEFTATYTATDEKYSVEAKSREIESSNSSRAKVGRKLYEALEKKANHKRLIFLDLNKPLHTEEAAEIAVDRAERIIRQSEELKIDGEPAPAAYVCITNMNDQYALDTSTLATMISLRGFKIHDFMGDEFPSLREAARARERHWPMFQLFKSMEEHREIPQTFGGELPSEVFVPNAPPRLQVGQFYAVPGPDGVEVNAKLMQATVANDKAHCILHDPATNKSWLGTFDMTPDELADYAKHPDTYFGVYQRQTRRVETAMEMFDFFIAGYRDTPKEQLMKLLQNYADQESLHAMSQKDLAELLAENYTIGAIANGFAVKSPRNKRRSPPAK